MQETSEILFSSSTVPRHFTNAGRSADGDCSDRQQELRRNVLVDVARQRLLLRNVAEQFFQVRELDPMPRYCSMVSWHVLSTCHDCSISWNRVCLTCFRLMPFCHRLFTRGISDADRAVPSNQNR